MGADVLTDSRQGSNKQHLLEPLLRQSTHTRLAGYEDVKDVRGDPRPDRTTGVAAAGSRHAVCRTQQAWGVSLGLKRGSALKGGFEAKTRSLKLFLPDSAGKHLKE